MSWSLDRDRGNSRACTSRNKRDAQLKFVNDMFASFEAVDFSENLIICNETCKTTIFYLKA